MLAIKAGDSVAAWLNPTLASHLEAADIFTLAQLVDRINGVGRRWHAGIKAMGAGKALRIVESGCRRCRTRKVPDQNDLMGKLRSAVGVLRTAGPKVNAGRSFSLAQWQFIEGQLKMLPATSAIQRLRFGLHLRYATGLPTDPVRRQSEP